MGILIVVGLVGLVGVGIYYANRKPKSIAQTFPRAELSEWRMSGQASGQAEESKKVLYENEERINLIRDSEGHITEFIIHRRVTQDG